MNNLPNIFEQDARTIFQNASTFQRDVKNNAIADRYIKSLENAQVAYSNRGDVNIKIPTKESIIDNLVKNPNSADIYQSRSDFYETSYRVYSINLQNQRRADDLLNTIKDGIQEKIDEFDIDIVDQEKIWNEVYDSLSHSIDQSKMKNTQGFTRMSDSEIKRITTEWFQNRIKSSGKMPEANLWVTPTIGFLGDYFAIADLSETMLNQNTKVLETFTSPLTNQGERQRISKEWNDIVPKSLEGNTFISIPYLNENNRIEEVKQSSLEKVLNFFNLPLLRKSYAQPFKTTDASGGSLADIKKDREKKSKELEAQLKKATKPLVDNTQKLMNEAKNKFLTSGSNKVGEQTNRQLYSEPDGSYSFINIKGKEIEFQKIIQTDSGEYDIRTYTVNTDGGEMKSEQNIVTAEQLSATMNNSSFADMVVSGVTDGEKFTPTETKPESTEQAVKEVAESEEAKDYTESYTSWDQANTEYKEVSESTYEFALDGPRQTREPVTAEMMAEKTGITPPKFFRIPGRDGNVDKLYDAETLEYIDFETWGQNYRGHAEEVDIPDEVPLIYRDGEKIYDARTMELIENEEQLAKEYAGAKEISDPNFHEKIKDHVPTGTKADDQEFFQEEDKQQFVDYYKKVDPKAERSPGEVYGEMMQKEGKHQVEQEGKGLRKFTKIKRNEDGSIMIGEDGKPVSEHFYFPVYTQEELENMSDEEKEKIINEVKAKSIAQGMSEEEWTNSQEREALVNTLNSPASSDELFRKGEMSSRVELTAKKQAEKMAEEKYKDTWETLTDEQKADKIMEQMQQVQIEAKDNYGEEELLNVSGDTLLTPRKTEEAEEESKEEEETKEEPKEEDDKQANAWQESQGTANEIEEEDSYTPFQQEETKEEEYGRTKGYLKAKKRGTIAGIS